MTQYQRITGKVFGGNATATGNDPQIAQFGSALANTFVGTTDPETIQSLPAWGQGWIGAVTPDTQFPPLPEMTGAMKVLSHQICGILQQGVSTWDSGTIYYTDNFCSKNGNIYKSLTDENQGNDPEADTTNWRSYGGADKADTNASNFTTEGKSLISGFGMPSNQYISLTLGATETTYTAPANGYFMLSGTTTSTSRAQVALYADDAGGYGNKCVTTANSDYIIVCIPIQRGIRTKVSYTDNLTNKLLRFIYAQGEV